MTQKRGEKQGRHKGKKEEMGGEKDPDRCHKCDQGGGRWYVEEEEPYPRVVLSQSQGLERRRPTRLEATVLQLSHRNHLFAR